MKESCHRVVLNIELSRLSDFDSEYEDFSEAWKDTEFFDEDKEK